MKKILFGFVIISGCFAPACSSPVEPKSVMDNTIINSESLPDGQCLYTIAAKDSTPYTFIDSCGKYSVGEQF